MVNYYDQDFDDFMDLVVVIDDFMDEDEDEDGDEDEEEEDDDDLDMPKKNQLERNRIGYDSCMSQCVCSVCTMSWHCLVKTGFTIKFYR